MKISAKFPTEVKKIFDIFGDDVRLVGGCVRDLLLKKKINDFDFATRFLPEETTKILEKNKIKAVPTGIKFGTITAVINGKNFEITTLRKDSKTDGRHCEPEFVDDYAIDAARRDFTINALYLDHKGLVTDYFGGLLDLENRRVKFIGDAHERIKEDYLRILRFFRFSSFYANDFNQDGLDACIKQKCGLQKLSRERVRMEFLKILQNKNRKALVDALRCMSDIGILSEIFSLNLDIESFSAAMMLEQEIGVDFELLSRIAVLFLCKDFDIRIFITEFCTTNRERSYLSFLLKNSFLSDRKDDRNSDEVPVRSELKKASGAENDFKIIPKFDLLPFYKKELVLELYLFEIIKIGNVKKLDHEDYLFVRANIDVLQNFVLPKFPLSSKEVIDLGFSDKMIGEVTKQSKIFWARTGFKADKSEIISFLKSATVAF